MICIPFPPSLQAWYNRIWLAVTSYLGFASRSVIAALTNRLGISSPDGRVNGVLIVIVMMEVLGISGRMGLRGENQYGRRKANEPVQRYEN